MNTADMRTEIENAGGPLSVKRADRLDRVPWGAVIVYVGISFALAWLVALPLWMMGTDAPEFSLMLGLLASVMMFTPLIAVLVVVFLLRVPAKERLRYLGIWPLRPAKRVVWWIVAAVFAPLLAVAGSVLIAAACGWVQLDLLHFSGFAETLQASIPESAQSSMPAAGVLVAMQLILIPFGAVINSFLAFGEEVGWRGWLLVSLRPLGVWPSLLLSGAIWGLWHSPLILLGYNFGLTDWRGVALMTTGCMAWGILFGWARLRTASVWPAVVGHGALNASASLVGLVAASDSPMDLALVSPLGAAGWIMIAVISVVLVLTGQFKREPVLAPRRIR